MELSITPITPANIDAALALLGNRAAFTNREYAQFTRTLRVLVTQRRVFGRIVVEQRTDRARVFGLAAFVEPAVVDRFLERPHSCFGKELILTKLEAILDEAAIGAGNAGSGLHSVVLGQGFDLAGVSGDGFIWVFGTGMQAFMDAHRGYRIARVVNIEFGEIGRDALTEGGDFEKVAMYEDRYERGTVLTGVFTATRERAVANNSLLLPMFLYASPVVGFTRAEQDVIREALDGRTDAEISRALAISMTATKARWNRIHLRFFTRLPDLDRRAPQPNGRGRGEQMRHIILEYVRRNLCELTPHAG
jgi:hypothetical protein